MDLKLLSTVHERGTDGEVIKLRPGVHDIKNKKLQKHLLATGKAVLPDDNTPTPNGTSGVHANVPGKGSGKGGKSGKAAERGHDPEDDAEKTK